LALLPHPLETIAYEALRGFKVWCVFYMLALVNISTGSRENTRVYWPYVKGDDAWFFATTSASLTVGLAVFSLSECFPDITVVSCV
jgi:hypothetical protein